MEGSIHRVRQVLQGRRPDRAPLFDLLRNDAVLSHFGGRRLDFDNAQEVVYRAHGAALDATRPAVRLPQPERCETLPDGRTMKYLRWTAWQAPRFYASPEEFAQERARYVETFDAAWNAERQRALDEELAFFARDRHRLGDLFYFPATRGVGIQPLYTAIGLEQFCLFMLYYPQLIDDLLECSALEAIAWCEHLPADHGIEAVFVSEDMASKNGPLFSLDWLDRHYFPRLQRVIAAYHQRGILVMFHSDGNLMPVLDRLVAAGIDGLNPLEVQAGMDPVQIHNRYPKLFLSGGIDVSNLLPFATPDEIRRVVRRTLEGTGGRLLVGSSTELNQEVPLENYLALHETALNFTLD
ncbi:MAG TPA: uroporphyrinogen decarboxylase family protein [Candidatus Sumerlaeota bacterium]|nr:uroporphyrinogen decarboxylase family protein [Candidatus Sumerlaeota bacterium]HPK02241.1 uroporphyrinogen decarboxylase family protein [Candidatus Sumerlaeota bacterium]